MVREGDNMMGVKRANRSAVLRLLHEEGGMSRKRIAESMRLTPAAITKIVGELIEEGIVKDGKMLPGGGAGRREVLVDLDVRSRCALGILINLRQAIVSAVWLDGTVIFSEEVVLEAAAPADETLELLCSRLLALSAQEGLREEQILGVGVAIRGITSIDGQTVLNSFGALDCKNYPLVERVEELTGLRTVMSNNVRALFAAQVFLSRENELHSQFFLRCEYGIGASLSIRDRIWEGGTNQCCPVCNYSKRVDTGENDLESQAPWLMGEWDFQRNTVDPSKIPVHSNILAYWKCEKNHSWKATPNNRMRTGCPVCNANRLSRGENSLDVVDPVVSAQWSKKNYPKTPRDVTAYCNEKYIWECSEGHEWTATVANRHLGEGCPYCTHRKADTGKNDLKTKFPLIASQFRPELNNGKKPEDSLPFSNELIVWECSEKHHWKAPIYYRTLLSSKCPYCNNLKADAGRTDLETVRPDIAAEFKPKLNNGKKPSDYLPNSGERINWLCLANHVWSCSIRDRVQNGRTCPTCKGVRRAVRKTI